MSPCVGLNFFAKATKNLSSDWLAPQGQFRAQVLGGSDGFLASVMFADYTVGCVYKGRLSVRNSLALSGSSGGLATTLFGNNAARLPGKAAAFVQAGISTIAILRVAT